MILYTLDILIEFINSKILVLMVSASCKQMAYFMYLKHMMGIWGFFSELFIYFCHLLNHSEMCFFFSLELDPHMKQILYTLWKSYWSDSLKCCCRRSHGESIVCFTACSRITINTGSFYSSSGFHWSVWMFFTSSETDTVDVYTSQPVNGFMWSHKTLKSEFENLWVHRAHIHMPTAHIQYNIPQIKSAWNQKWLYLHSSNQFPLDKIKSHPNLFSCSVFWFT